MRPTKLRVGMIPYLNAWPYRPALLNESIDWEVAHPRRLGARAAAGRLDAALLASRDALALADRFEPLGRFGIACNGPVGSVLLLSRRSPTLLAGGRIALSRESRTSRALVRIVLESFLGLPNLTYHEDETDADARLVIGDEALALRGNRRFPHALDLGEMWSRATGLPFVYARFVVRRDLPVQERDALFAALHAALETPLDLAKAPRPAGIDDLAALGYLAPFVYRLGEDEERGLACFARALAERDLLRHHPSKTRAPDEIAADAIARRIGAPA